MGRFLFSPGKVTRAMDQQGKMALETQRNTNKMNNEILENRRRTHKLEQRPNREWKLTPIRPR